MNSPASNAAEGCVYWITGLAGVGKSTLARVLVQRLRARGRGALLLDGDELRAALFPDAGHTPDERLELALRYSRLCGLLARQGHDVVCATISLHPRVWAQNRRDFAHYREVLLRAPAAVRSARRPELQPASAGPVVGRELDAPEPGAPDACIDNDGTRTPTELVEELLQRLDARAKVEGARA